MRYVLRFNIITMVLGLLGVITPALAQGQNHSFTNMVKEREKWGIAIMHNAELPPSVKR